MKYESTSDILVVLVEATDDRTEVMQRLAYAGDQPKPVLVVLPGDAVLRRPGDLRELRYVIESQGHQSMLVIMGNERLRLWAQRQGYIVFSSIETCVGVLLQQGIASIPQILQEARRGEASISRDWEYGQPGSGGAEARWEEGTQGETYSPISDMDAKNRVPTLQMTYPNLRKDSMGGVSAYESGQGSQRVIRGEEVAVWVADANNVVDRDTEPLQMRQRSGGGKASPYVTRELDAGSVMDLGYVDVQGVRGGRTFFVEDDAPSMPERGSGERWEEESLELPTWAKNGMAWGEQFDARMWEQVKEDKVLGMGAALGIARDRVLITLILLLGAGIAGGVVLGSILYR